MDKNKVRKDGRVFCIVNIEIEKEEFKDPCYEIKLEKCVTESMYIVAGRIIPNDKTLPSFIFRWDEKSDQLDVDIENVSEEIRNEFRSCKNGYSGHQPIKAYDKGRHLEINITIPPCRNIFKGIIKYTVEREAELEVNIKSEVTIVKEIIETTKNT